MRNALLLFFLLPFTCPAACTDQTGNKGSSSTYNGTISSYPVRFELAQTNGKVSGYYFYVSQLKDIRLTGTIVDGKQVQLHELGADGKPEAEINGEFPDEDPQGKLKGPLGCDIITGTWQNADGSKKLPLFLRTIASAPDSHGHRYEVAGANDDETINRAAVRFRKAVVEGDKETVASAIRYPIAVYLDHKKTKIENRESLVANYDAVFSPSYRKAIENSIPRDMFARYDGIMLGDHGEVWFDDKGRVASLNNLPPK